MAVVDPDLRVIGLKKLRIVDSSVFPTVPNGNLNGPTMMVAEARCGYNQRCYRALDFSEGIYRSPVSRNGRGKGRLDAQ